MNNEQRTVTDKKHFKLRFMLTYYDDLLPIFLSRDELRPGILQANPFNDFVFATDAHSVIMVSKEKLINKYPAHKKCPNLQAIIDGLVELDPPVKFKDTDLFAVLNNVPKEWDWKPCPDCKGEGYTECSCCGHRSDCEECEGDGSVPDRSLPKVYTYTGYQIMFNGAAFSPHLLGRLEKVLLELEAEEFTLTHGGEAIKPHLFVVKDVKILIMPRIASEQSDEVKTFYLKSV